MNVFNVEIFSLIIIIIIVGDYVLKYKNNFDGNSNLFFVISSSIFLISLFNIFISMLNMPVKISYALLILNYTLAIVPSITINIYIKKNYLNEKNIKNRSLYLIIFGFVYFTLILYVFLSAYSTDFYEFLSIKNHFVNMGADKYLLLLTTLPFLDIIIRFVIFSIKERNVSLNGLFMVAIIPAIAIYLDLIFENIIFLGPCYTISLLMLYLYKNTLTLNIDPLTQIYNRRVLESGQYLKIANSKKMAFYLFDVDKFKNINDTYGHKAGDKILSDVSFMLKSSVRKTDYVIRYGGDEFLIIAYIKNENDIKIIVDKIYEKIKNYNNHSKISVSLSVGYDIYEPKEQKSLKRFINKIDNKMYDDKEKHHKN